jgi:putative membrane protein
MGLFVLVFALEVWPMATFIRWRIASKKGVVPDFSRVAALARINDLELMVVVLIPFVAAFMARGVWLF